MTSGNHGTGHRFRNSGPNGTGHPGRNGIGGAQCPVCRAWTYDDDLFCACCGTPLTEGGIRSRHPVSIYCTQCGISLEDPAVHPYAALNIRKEKHPPDGDKEEESVVEETGRESRPDPES